MRNGHLLFSAVQFFLILALFSSGAALFGLHYIPGARLRFAEWIIDPSTGFVLLGSVITATALLLTICFWIMQRGSYVRIEMKKGSTSVHEDAIRAAVLAFWEENKLEKPSDVYCANQKIEIITEAKDQDLAAIEQKLGSFLSKQFGYDREFYVTLRAPTRNIDRYVVKHPSS